MTTHTRHLDTAIAILGGAKCKPSLAAAKKAAKATSTAKVLKLDATTGQVKAVAATTKQAPKGGHPKACPKTLALAVTGRTDTQKCGTQEAAVTAAISLGRGRTAVLQVVPGVYMLGRRRHGLLKGWTYVGRAGDFAEKVLTT